MTQDVGAEHWVGVTQDVGAAHSCSSDETGLSDDSLDWLEVEEDPGSSSTGVLKERIGRSDAKRLICINIMYLTSQT